MTPNSVVKPLPHQLTPVNSIAICGPPLKHVITRKKSRGKPTPVPGTKAPRPNSIPTQILSAPTMATPTKAIRPFVPQNQQSVFYVATITAPTLHDTVKQPRSSTGPPATCNGDHPQTKPERTSMEKATASDGMVPLGVNKVQPAPTEVTSAPYAVIHPTVPNRAPLVIDFLTIVTPFISSAWENMLHNKGLSERFRDVPIGIRFGFDMGVLAPPTTTYTPSNHTSALMNPAAVTSQIRKELSLGRYTGPFSRDRLERLIGPFRTSPLGVILKTGTVDEYRLVQDFSYPRNDPNHPSVNSEIDMEKYRCDWGTFTDVASIVMDAPPYAEAATLDVDAAFRRCPIRLEQQSSFIVGWEEKYYIDHNAPFGAASSGGVFGRITDALMAIFRACDIGPATNWVDDCLFFNFPVSVPNSDDPTGTPTFPYTIDTIFELTSQLGWPWKASKTRPFSRTFRYLGFEWDLEHKSVQIPSEKKIRYLTKLEPWTEDSKFTRREAEAILGTLVHCSLAVPEGRSRLPSISRFAASFIHSSSEFRRRTPNKTILADIQWWRDCLTRSFCGSSLLPPPPLSPINFWVDASTEWGIGVVFNNEWDSWKLRDNWKSNGRNIGWAEFVAIEIGLLLAVERGHHNTHFLIRSDNQGVIYAIQGGKSRSPEQNIVLQRITNILSIHSLHISSLYVPSADNISDRPSRGLPVEGLRRSTSTFTIPPPLLPFINSSPTLLKSTR